MDIHLTRNRASRNNPQEQRSDEAGIDKYSVIHLLHIIYYSIIISERKSCSPRNDAQQHNDQWDMQVDGHGCIDIGETYKKDDDGNNEPHVVSFPNRADRMVADLACLRPVILSSKQFNNTRAEIGPA